MTARPTARGVDWLGEGFARGYISILTRVTLYGAGRSGRRCWATRRPSIRDGRRVRGDEPWFRGRLSPFRAHEQAVAFGNAAVLHGASPQRGHGYVRRL